MDVNDVIGVVLEMGDELEYVSCNLCGSDDSMILFTGKDRLFKKPGLFNVVKCKKCGLTYTNPRPNRKTISQYYPTQYWNLKTNPNNQKNLVSKKLLKKLSTINQKLIDVVCYKMTIPLKRNGKLLDIGCGDGKFLFSMRELGWVVYGVEISDLAARNARDVLSLNCFSGTIDEASFPDKFFDGITMHQVLEHVADPTETLLEVNRILKDDGILAISVPDADSLEAFIFKNCWFPWDIPRHFSHFSQNSIKQMLDKTGFDIKMIKHDPHPAGALNSIQYIFDDMKMDYRIKYLLTYTLAFPLAYIMSIFLGKINSSGSMAIFSRKKL
jgi:2-polyprenyl-3-methyl-5-hydroxy-6-metoxy-1,4-benzoquinol methylase